MGHSYMILLVMLCQTLVYREVTRLFLLTDLKTKHTERDVWSNTLNWYFFAVANYFLYGESIIYYFKVGRVFVCFMFHTEASNSM
jgi:phosphatidate cytidylyltransferase